MTIAMTKNDLRNADDVRIVAALPGKKAIAFLLEGTIVPCKWTLIADKCDCGDAFVLGGMVESLLLTAEEDRENKYVLNHILDFVSAPYVVSEEF